jgi:4-hydroxy-tetrahydrodipicolinate synthase
MLKPYGIIPAMVTPLTSQDEINEPALRKLTNHLVDGGSHAIFTIGSQGEFWAFTREEKRRIAEVVVDEVKGRVPVYSGTAAITTRETISLTKDAEAIGVDAVSILTPFFLSPTEHELYDHYRAIAEATSLPIVLYTNPDRTGVNISPGLLKRLAEIDNIVGIKDSSGDLQLTAQFVQVVPDEFSVLMGRDTLILAGLIYGAKGSIAATANVKPDLVVSIYERFIAGDLAGARAAQEALAPLRLAFSWGTFPVVIKEALDLMGMDAGPSRAPVGPMSAEKRDQLREVLVGMGVIKR